MSKGQRLRALVSERLTAAAEEIFALVERTIAEYEQELCQCKEENQRKQQLLDQVLSPEVPAPSTDVQIQTERSSEAELFKQEEDVSCVIVKSEGGGSDNEDDAEAAPASPRPMETESSIAVYILDPDPEAPLPENPTLETATLLSGADITNGDGAETVKECPPGKRKRGRPRRVMASADAVEKRLQRSAEGRVETRSVGRGATVPTTTSPPQVETPMEDVTVCLKDPEKTPEKSKCPKDAEKCVTALLDKAETGATAAAAGEFSCSSCDRVFTRLHHLERHVLVHTGERSFCCSVCDKSFRLKQHLISHMTIHRDERLFICPLCPRRFKRKDNLGRHIMVHSGLRPYGCTQCDVQFSLKKNLLRHMIVHDRDITLSCSICRMRFSSPYYFQRHLKTHKRK